MVMASSVRAIIPYGSPGHAVVKTSTVQRRRGETGAVVGARLGRRAPVEPPVEPLSRRVVPRHLAAEATRGGAEGHEGDLVPSRGEVDEEPRRELEAVGIVACVAAASVGEHPLPPSTRRAGEEEPCGDC